MIRSLLLAVLIFSSSGAASADLASNTPQSNSQLSAEFEADSRRAARAALIHSFLLGATIVEIDLGGLIRIGAYGYAVQKYRKMAADLQAAADLHRPPSSGHEDLKGKGFQFLPAAVGCSVLGGLVSATSGLAWPVALVGFFGYVVPDLLDDRFAKASSTAKGRLLSG